MNAADASPSPPEGGEGSSGLGAWHPALLLTAAIFLAYANALLWGEFQFDDFNVIVDNLRVHSWQAWWADVDRGRSIRPLLKFSYTLDWSAGWGVAGFHLTNILIHLINALLVLQLTQRFCCSTGQPRLQQQSASIALFSALLFALHPIHSEAISYVCGRSAAMMTMFYLGGLLAYATGRATQDRRLLHVLVPLCFLLALAVKETAVSFPLALLAWELCCGGTLKSALRRQWSSWSLLTAGALFFLTNANHLTQMERSAALNSLTGNLATQSLALAWLLRQWLAPFWLNIDPDLPILRDFSNMKLLALPLSLMIALLLATLASYRQRPWISFALAWLLIQLVPLHLFLPRLDVANERQMYLAGWPLALLLTTELALRLRARTFMSVAVVLLLLAGALTIARNRDYQSEIRLWQATVRLSPDKARAHNNLGYAYALGGRQEEARAEYQRALQLDPEYFKARANLARLNAPSL